MTRSQRLLLPLIPFLQMAALCGTEPSAARAVAPAEPIVAPAEPIVAPSGPTRDAAPPTAEIQVHPGDDLVALVNGAPEGSRIFLHTGPNGRHVYEIGRSVLVLPNGATIRGPDARRGPLGEIDAPVAIRGSGPQIFDQRERVGWTIEHLDISGARWIADDNLDGTCIGLGQGTLRYVKIHDCDNRGLGAWSGLLEYAELTNNSARQISGHSAASKSIYPHTIRHTYVHGNHHTGVWTDCDNDSWTVEDSRIVDNFGTGVFNEISRGPSVLRRNVIQGNNKGRVEGRGGLVITSSMGVTVEENVVTGNGEHDVRIWEDPRAGRGPAGCETGYRTLRVLLSGNTIGSSMGMDGPGVARR